MRRKIVPYHLAALHYEANAFAFLNIGEGIFGDGDEIREIPGFHKVSRNRGGLHL